MSALKAISLAEQAAEWDAKPEGERSSLFMPNLGTNSLSIGNAIEYRYSSIEDAFPEVDPGHIPLGCLVLAQIRQPKMRTAGGLEIITDTRQTEHYNTQVAKVIAVGPLAFHNRDTYEEWPEGAWCAPGSFVRVPKYQGDRWTVSYMREDFSVDPTTGARTPRPVADEVCFCLFKDLSLLATVKDPLTAKAFT